MITVADTGVEIGPPVDEIVDVGRDIPIPGSLPERERFGSLQRRLAPLVRHVFPDKHAEQTVVVIPSMSLPREELLKLAGANHYEERLLCLLMLLRA